MIRNMKLRLLFILSILCTHEAMSQVSKPKYANEFLAIGVGARSFAMGGATVASVNDATAAYWNPANLMRLEHDYNVGLMHSEYFAGIASYDYGGFATPVDDQSMMALTVIRFAVDDIPDTRFLYDANGALNYDNIRFFSAADYAFQFSYAREMPWLEGLNIGGNIKVIHRTVGDFANAWGFGLDVSAYWQKDNLDLGLVFRDASGTFTTWYHNIELIEETYALTGNAIPENTTELAVPRMILGTAYTINLPYKFSFLTEVNLDVTFDGARNTYISEENFSIDPRGGVELAYDHMAFLRAGVNNIQRIRNFDGSERWNGQANLGVGFRYKLWQIDYAYTDLANASESLYSHVFSISISWDAKE